MHAKEIRHREEAKAKKTIAHALYPTRLPQSEAVSRCGAWFNSEARKQIVSEIEHDSRKCAVLFARIC